MFDFSIDLLKKEKDKPAERPVTASLGHKRSPVPMPKEEPEVTSKSMKPSLSGNYIDYSISHSLQIFTDKTRRLTENVI